MRNVCNAGGDVRRPKANAPGGSPPLALPAPAARASETSATTGAAPTGDSWRRFADPTGIGVAQVPAPGIHFATRELGTFLNFLDHLTRANDLHLSTSRREVIEAELRELGCPFIDAWFEDAAATLGDRKAVSTDFQPLKLELVRRFAAQFAEATQAALSRARDERRDLTVEETRTLEGLSSRVRTLAADLDRVGKPMPLPAPAPAGAPDAERSALDGLPIPAFARGAVGEVFRRGQPLLQAIAGTLSPDRPNLSVVKAISDNIIAPLAEYHGYQAKGLENIPEGPCIIALNHSLATYDVMLFGRELLEKRQRLMRMLVDHIIAGTPGLGQIAALVGAADGRPKNAVALLKAGETVGVCPGGMDEALRPSTQKYKYQITWDELRNDRGEVVRKPHLGFARVAMDTGVPVVPVACARADDIYRVYDNPVTREALRFHIPIPFAGGRFNTIIPEPVQLQHVVGKPIYPPQLRPGAKFGDPDYDEALRRFHAEIVAAERRLMEESLKPLGASSGGPGDAAGTGVGATALVPAESATPSTVEVELDPERELPVVASWDLAEVIGKAIASHDLDLTAIGRGKLEVRMPLEPGEFRLPGRRREAQVQVPENAELRVTAPFGHQAGDVHVARANVQIVDRTTGGPTTIRVHNPASALDPQPGFFGPILDAIRDAMSEVEFEAAEIEATQRADGQVEGEMRLKGEVKTLLGWFDKPLGVARPPSRLPAVPMSLAALTRKLGQNDQATKPMDLAKTLHQVGAITGKSELTLDFESAPTRLAFEHPLGRFKVDPVPIKVQLAAEVDLAPEGVVMFKPDIDIQLPGATAKIRSHLTTEIRDGKLHTTAAGRPHDEAR